MDSIKNGSMKKNLLQIFEESPLMDDLAKAARFLHHSGRGGARVIGIVVQTPAPDEAFNVEFVWNEEYPEEDRSEILKTLLEANLQPTSKSQ
jgi:hypothetical protein